MSYPENYDFLALEAIEHAPGNDPWGAKEALRIAARYIREGKPIPPPLDDYIAGAFEAAVEEEEPKKCVSKLAEKLNFKISHRREAGYWKDVGQSVEYCRDADVGEAMTYEKAVERTAEIYGISDSRVSKCYGKYLSFLQSEGREHGEIVSALRQAHARWGNSQS